MNPKDKSYQRTFKRHSAKVEIWQKGGFLRSDTLIGKLEMKFELGHLKLSFCSLSGAAAVKLQELETKCQIHDSFPVMDGRKPVGGQLEVKIRLRNPVVTKQIEKATEKWLVISFKH